MKGITLFYANKFHSLQNLNSKVVLNTESKIVIENNILSPDKINLYLVNPFNYIIDYFLFDKNSDRTISINFNGFMPSGMYYIKLIPYQTDFQIAQPEHDVPSAEYILFQFSGMFSQFNWSLTYAVSSIVKRGMDIRLAAPKQYFPFLLVESLEGRPISDITTDVWSNWLLYDTTNKMGTNEMMFGYRSNISSNYLLFTSYAFDKQYSFERSELIKYLISEPGIESSDQIIKEFGEKITANSLFGKIHQILYLITNYLQFKDQQGEFGAKYAVLNKQGDCTEYSALFTALCRCLQIPSRLVAGLKKIGSVSQKEWIRHAWSEIYFEGLWIPIDVVEAKAKIIGYHPDLIPLFKGNWMAENMNRELKISIMDEFKESLTPNDLIESYSKLAISYKVQATNHDESTKNSVSYVLENDNSLELQVEKNQNKDSEVAITILCSQLEKNSILGVYYKVETISTVKSPKMVHYLERIKEKKLEKHSLQVKTPDFPGTFELGVFICSIYGEIKGVTTIYVKVV